MKFLAELRPAAAVRSDFFLGEIRCFLHHWDYPYLQCETLLVDFVQEETTSLDQEADTCKQTLPGYPYETKDIIILNNYRIYY